MQVPNVSFVQNNNNKYNQNFTSIRKFEYTGLFKKYPELAKELVDTFKGNDEVMEFCSAYPTNVVLHSFKQAMDSVEAAVCIFYKNEYKGKWTKLVEFFTGSDDKVIISSYGNKYNVADSLKDATARLKAAMSPEDTTSELPTGLLNSHVRSARAKLKQAYSASYEAFEQGKSVIKAKDAKKAARLENQAELEHSINGVIESTK